jgi:hypothetical protein
LCRHSFTSIADFGPGRQAVWPPHVGQR